jgi:hypothetical protein
MCSAESPGRASGDAHIATPRVQPRTGSRPFHRGAPGSLNRVRERGPNCVLPLLRFLPSLTVNLMPRPQKGPPFVSKGTYFGKGPVPAPAEGIGWQPGIYW